MQLELFLKENYIIGYEGKDISSPLRMHILLGRERKKD